MRTLAVCTAVLWLAALAGAQHARTVRGELMSVDLARAPRILQAPVAHAELPIDSLAEWGGALVRYNPFRASRTSLVPPVEEVEPIAPVMAAVAVQQPEHPTLKGIVGSAGGWDAVLVTPAMGRGALVRAGDSLGVYHVREVTPAEVLLQGPDSLLRLTLTATNPPEA